jgi:hypothetical protein
MSVAEASLLGWVAKSGGGFVVDRYGRFLAGGDIRSQGYSSSMLRLIARGYVEGHDGRFTITRLGMSALADRED